MTKISASTDKAKHRCGVSYPHPPHGTCTGAASKPWPFPLPCEKCNDTGWCHGAQEWTPERMRKGTPYKSVRCDCGATKKAVNA